MFYDENFQFAHWVESFISNVCREQVFSMEVKSGGSGGKREHFYGCKILFQILFVITNDFV